MYYSSDKAYYDAIDNAESFEEYLEENFTPIGEHNGEVVYVDGDDYAFKADGSANWVQDGDDSYWDYDKTEVEYSELIEMLMEINNGEKDDSNNK